LAGLGLPTAPFEALVVANHGRGPQPRRDAGRGRGMTVTVGRIRRCPVLSVRFVVLVHNTVRGAAGGALLNAELLARRGWLPRRR
jgi:aspartate-semialdehyde dehydrogenase